jgi:hypothetical protein
MRGVSLFGVVVSVLIGQAVTAWGQGAVPTVGVVRWTVTRITGEVVYDLLDPNGISPDTIAALMHEELDTVAVRVRIRDADWVPPPDPNQEPTFEETFLRFTAWSNLFYAPPEPPPIRQASFVFFPEEEGFTPTGSDQNGYFAEVPLVFQIPEFLGTNQLRHRGRINFDCEWIAIFAVSNEQSPENADQGQCPGDIPPRDTLPPRTVYCAFYPVRAIESPLLAPPNPKPFADAGPDRAVLPNTVVKLDGSRSFDSSNFGFAAEDDVNIFEKDKLTFTWEWISGPERVDPVQTDPRDPVATVVFTQLGDYVYRLTVSDNVNAPPSQDSVTISVVEKLPANRGPRARITGPPGDILIGTVVTLDGTGSTDPDGDDLSYRWEQTNELGGPLDPNDLRRLFQPVSGLTESRLSWQAVREGTFYFRLTVSDGRLTSATNFSVNVVNPAVEGVYVVGWASPPPPDGSGSGSSGTGKEAGDTGSDALAEPRGLCGAGGLFGLGFAALALVTARRRYR